ncbi:MAG: hypothetical protein VB060_05645 [Oscillibacter sp.]|nr:hypothetical protein [Oscillibacter sp.]MEA4993308.1 hypothetical protein [Oscillibacter sp.]
MKKSVKGILSLALAFTLIFAMLVPASAATGTSADTKAAALKQLGLLQGVSATEDNFELDRAPTRVEALVMLIRALGKDTEAISVGGTHPFTDVPAWADKYIGYAYEKGYTKGSSATMLGTGAANSDMYLTFMLRALGYSDTAGDFSWDAPDALAKAVGILPDEVDTENFLRADVALISWAALEADLKGGSQRMAKKLMADGVFTGDEYGKAIDLVNEAAPTAVSVSTLEALKTALADKTAKAISIDASVTVTGDLTIPAGVSVTVNRGYDLNVEGAFTNNGTLNVMGADKIVSADFINYSVVNVRSGGKFINNGAVNLLPASLKNTEDLGPVGGQLRVFDGSFTNNGSVFLKAAQTNTHGGMLVVAEGPFANNGVVIVDGFQIVVANTFTNNKGAVVINNTYICTRDAGAFTGNGTLSGNPVVKE